MIEDATLHVFIAATHIFDDTVMETVVSGNANPIEKLERSSVVVASTIHGVPLTDVIASEHLESVKEFIPILFE